jgi:hypothetical protein
MEPRSYLRLEGLAAFVGALAVYFALDGVLWLLAVLALGPDLSMAGYLAGQRVGSLTYNVFHTYTLPLALAAVGVWLASTFALHVAAIWTGHIGADRLLGYGLKYETGFKQTHLSTQPAPLDALTETN